MDRDAWSDADLVRAAQAGDTASLGVLLERYRPALHALALHILGHGPQSQDAVHDTFVIALNRLHTLQDPGAVGAWLRAVARNVCLEALRKAPATMPLDDLSIGRNLRSPEASLEERIDHLALKDWVWAALSELPENLRVTAILRYFGTRSSYEEIASVLGVPTGTVKSRLNQAKVKLAEALLTTANLDHSPARQLTESTTDYFLAATDQINRGRGYDIFADAFSDHPELMLPDGITLRGRQYLIESLEEDMDVGIKMHLSHVYASKNITVLEATFENPADDPTHCPPATTQVHFKRDGKADRIRLYFAPRPGTKPGNQPVSEEITQSWME